MSVVTPCGEIGQRLSDVLGIERLVDCKIHFPLEGMISAEVVFLLDEKQVNSLLALFEDGKWRSPEYANREVDVSTMDGSQYRKFAPGHGTESTKKGPFDTFPYDEGDRG